MNYAQYHALVSPTPTLTGADLFTQTPRTLLLGSTEAGEVFHAYLDEAGKIQTVVYDRQGQLVAARDETAIANNQAYVEGVWLAPERCDVEFCEALRGEGLTLPFDGFGRGMPPNILFFGRRREELGEAVALKAA